jgi:hypothetical protein
MRVRLRAAHPPAMLALLYATPHRHDRWADHRARVEATIALAIELGVPESVADLSCGDAAIVRALADWAQAQGQPVAVTLGDIAPGYELHGPIEQTLHQLGHVGLLVCTETIEHLDDPDAVLALARVKAGMLVLSTPLSEMHAGNPEHYWGWDKDGVRDMLSAAGWLTVIQRDISCESAGATWTYQLWGCV